MKRLTVAGLLLIALVCNDSPLISPASLAQGDDKPKQKTASGPRVYKGRVIAPVMTAAGGGAEWLERPDRDETEQPDKVIEALKIAPGSVVADVGAGTGYFSIRIAKKIGPEGKVLATDVQPEMLRQLTENMKKAGVKNIDRILATANDAKLPAGKVDLALMVDVYHELQDPERTMAQIRKSLKDDGRLVLVEYRGEDPSVPIKPEHKTTLRQIRYEIEPMGFRLKEVFEFLVHQHIEVFVKDDVKGEDVITDPSNFPTIRRPGWAGVGEAEPYEAAGFTRLFNGKDLTGWGGDAKIWSVRDGVLVGVVPDGKAKDTDLCTTQSFGDFELDLQWRLKDPKSGSGVRVRSQRSSVKTVIESGVPIDVRMLVGCGIIIADGRYGEVTEGIASGWKQPATDTSNAIILPGEWNRYTIRCVVSRIAIAVNGVSTARTENAKDGKNGSIVLQPSQRGVEFREVWIKQLGQ